MRTHNFSAGPGALPEAVLHELKAELPAYRDLGTSVIEISHRSAAYTEIANSARALLRTLLGLGEDWHVLFLQGGASTQFFQVPMNFLGANRRADYLDTGAWSKKAIAEARRFGDINVAASSGDANYNYIPAPEIWKLDPGATYLHFTSNNTIFGTQYATEPDVPMPLVCDASSDFLSRPLDLDKYGLIYAGAQKNIGPAGVTVVLIKDDFLQLAHPDLPTMLRYQTHVEKLFNTPPVFAVYLVEKVLRWLNEQGGIAGIAAQNTAKAEMLYNAIDGSNFYYGTAEKTSRSQMNVCFRLANPDLEPKFVAAAEAAGLQALKGHRSVGGIRASIYNACPPASVEALVDFMAEFEREHG